MRVRQCARADVVAEVARGARVQLARAPAPASGSRLADLAAQLDAGDERVDVRAGGQVRGSMSSAPSGSADRTRTSPRLAGRTRPAPSVKALSGPVSSASS